MVAAALLNYGIDVNLCNMEPIGSGLINRTWKIHCPNKSYILQHVNDSVFKYPQYIDDNILLLAGYLKKHYPDYLFVSPVKSLSGKTLICIEQSAYFRMLPFVESSRTYVATENKKQAYEAAKQFGRFTRLLSDLPLEGLKTVIPDFHNLSLRYAQFEKAVTNAGAERRTIAKDFIQYLFAQQQIVGVYEYITQHNILKRRVTHYDTKISNVLFNDSDEGLCVIDLDTVMPGYFISDVGDMIRTYVCPVTEEEKDTDKIVIREDYFKAIVNGYLNEMRHALSETETKYFVYAGEFMIYMQAIRFLTDYLNNDIYYGAKYETHNLVRAGNQIALLDSLIKKKELFNEIVADTLRKSAASDHVFF